MDNNGSQFFACFVSYVLEDKNTVSTFQRSTFVPGSGLRQVEVWDSVALTYTVFDGAGTQVSQRPLMPSEATDIQARELASIADANAESIRTKASQALTANATYLAIPAPTATEVRTQTELLTKEVNGLIRLLLNQLDDISDT